jgi:hypothetical protein
LDFHIKPRNHALCVNPEPTLPLGNKKSQVGRLVERFNQGDRKEALREMCEVFEHEVGAVAIKAARKGCSKGRRRKWSGGPFQEDQRTCGSKRVRGSCQSLGFSAPLKDNLQSFRTARNLADTR